MDETLLHIYNETKAVTRKDINRKHLKSSDKQLSVNKKNDEIKSHQLKKTKNSNKN